MKELKLMIVEGEGRKINEGVKVEGRSSDVVAEEEKWEEENDVFFLSGRRERCKWHRIDSIEGDG